MRYPPLRYYLEKILRNRGGARTGPLSSSISVFPVYPISHLSSSLSFFFLLVPLFTLCPFSSHGLLSNQFPLLLFFILVSFPIPSFTTPVSLIHHISLMPFVLVVDPLLAPQYLSLILSISANSSYSFSCPPFAPHLAQLFMFPSLPSLHTHDLSPLSISLSINCFNPSFFLSCSSSLHPPLPAHL